MNTRITTQALFAIVATISLLLGSHGRGEEADAVRPFEKSHLIGVWLAHQFESEAGDTKPRVEFKQEGTFRMLSQLGEEKTGTWKWKSDTVVALTYPEDEKTIEITIVGLNEEKMTSRVRRETEYVRLPSWTAKAPNSTKAEPDRPLPAPKSR